jgi:hypothetical protein
MDTELREKEMARLKNMLDSVYNNDNGNNNGGRNIDTGTTTESDGRHWNADRGLSKVAGAIPSSNFERLHTDEISTDFSGNSLANWR